MPQADFGNAVKCSLIAAVVRRFGEVRLRVTGTSMLPSVWPGDVVTVQQRSLTEVQIGQIVLFTWKDRLFVHRVVEKSGSVLVTRGDGLSKNDPPVDKKQLLGLVTAIQRGRKRFQPPAHLSRWERMSAAALRGSWLLRRVVPQLVTAWNA